MEIIDTTDIQANETNVDWYADGEKGDAIVFNRPLKQISEIVNSNDAELQDNIDAIVNTTIPSAITAALAARDNARYPVGHTLLTMTSTNPSVGGYPGTWTLLYTADSDIKLGDGSNQSGTASGDNDPVVPLKDHTHSTPNHTHTASSSTNGNHHHRIPAWSDSDGADGYVEDASGTGAERTTYTAFTGDHNHTITINSGGASTTGNTGDGSSPTLDVRGKGVAINVWQRTA